MPALLGHLVLEQSPGCDRSVPNGAPAGVAGVKRVATSATVKKSRRPTKTSEVPNTRRVVPDESFRCMKISATSALLVQAIVKAIGSAQLPRCALPVKYVRAVKKTSAIQTA